VHKFLKERGASFFQDISRGAGLLKSEIENALWELVTAGLVTADGFDNLRSLIDPKRRAGQSGGRGSSPRNTAGRWSLIFSDHPVERARSIEGLCRVLLHRYGVVFRDVVQRESNLPQWRELLAAFRLLEDRGEVRGGRFVHGFIGEQFALPEAVESLRAMRNRAPSEATATVSATDPLNLVGIILPGERTTALSNTSIQISC
jgi:ATP-dependent Lhr-like helicase